VNINSNISNTLLDFIQNHKIDSISFKKAKEYSLIECIKHDLLAKICQFNLSSEAMEILKKQISVNTYFNDTPCSYLEKKVLQLLINDEPDNLIKINPNGTIAEKNKNNEIFIINLNVVIRNLLPELNLSNDKNLLQLLSKNENEIIRHIRNENYHTIKVYKKNKKVHYAESLQRVSRNEDLTFLLKQKSFQNIEIKRDSGKTVSINRTIKTKLNKDYE